MKLTSPCLFLFPFPPKRPRAVLLALTVLGLFFGEILRMCSRVETLPTRPRLCGTLQPSPEEPLETAERVQEGEELSLVLVH